MCAFPAAVRSLFAVAGAICGVLAPISCREGSPPGSRVAGDAEKVGQDRGRHRRSENSAALRDCRGLMPCATRTRRIGSVAIGLPGRRPRDSRWLARWRDPGGRQRKRSFDRKIDAQRWLDQLRADMHRGQYIDPRAGSVRLREIATAWAGGLAHLKESTAVRYRGIVATHVLPAFGNWQLDQVRRSDVQQMLGHASAAMTLDVYAGLFEDDLDSVAAALDVLLTAASDDDTSA